ncbi:MAG: DNA methyltransferase [archaeon]
MKSYIFVIGRNHELSILELISYFQKNKINYEIKARNKNLLLINLDKEININELAGIIKIGELIENLDNLILKDKILYYTNSTSVKQKLKKIFKKERVKASFKENLESTRHLDLEILEINNKIALVTQISNPKEYKYRDESRPRFDNKRVISIRLAKILINISQANKEVLDPFCGCGTIIQEALLSNLDAIGIDTRIRDSELNLEWLSKNFKIKNNYKLIEGDATRTSSYVEKTECVVTEPYLGPFFREYPSEQEARRVIRNLQNLYYKTLREISKIVEKKIVIIVPIIKTRNTQVKFDFLDIIKENNLKVCSFKDVKIPIVYKTRNNIIFREIWILEKN